MILGQDDSAFIYPPAPRCWVMMSDPSFHHAAWITKVPTTCPTRSQSCPQGSAGLNSEYTEMLPTSVQPLQSSASSQLQKLKPNQIKLCCLRAWLTRVLECMDQHDNERCLKSIQIEMMRISRGKWRRSEDLQPNLPGRSLFQGLFRLRRFDPSVVEPFSQNPNFCTYNILSYIRSI